ncbi:hypothetical protein [Halarcobacter ebronensis]|uniref:Uncharacterized protein n=1 Tax=Halarcobacter ebronensis TaxID=1462615 RepID=A0A4Q1AG13_9BACT|nr:hypothetical protein [Halarcobacter ebronensis]QKF81428.1 hypothetical protein AEBR_0929 [Halarcobacter ebronensis]RXK02509.1 hypothetical protein CRV07_13650 [Halarcobacter ebronensis]
MRRKIEQFFYELENENDMTLNRVLSWGFFFSDDNVNLLKKAKELLASNDFSKIEVFYDNGTYHLCLEEITKHDIESLCQRCNNFKKFAKELKIEHFNGFDVEEPCLA